ncbi:MAG: energy transducer TonB [Micavibrio sp.]|nr:energy transducer TonB [Micavibrio sp.]|tara:strand:- start:4029 stop:4970 length:942 start_codon:yes stop_codon:yes gene_type:complete
MALKADKKQSAGVDYSSTKNAMTASLLLHFAVIVVFTVGVSFSDPIEIEENQPISIEFVDAEVAEHTAAPPKPVEKKEEPKEEPKPEPVKPEPVKSVEPPKSVDVPDPIKTPDPQTPIEDFVEEPKPEPVAEKKPEPKKPPVKPTPPKPKQDPKKVIEKAKEEKEKPKTDFSSVLKNLAGKERPQVEQEVTEDTNSETQVPDAVLTRIGTTLTISEQDLVRQQLAGCWNVVPGARDAQDLVVTVKMRMAPDATVQSAEIVNKGRYGSDPFFRAAADSALRAVRNPQCSPLKLPLDKYEQWKTITINFDPKDMF